VDRQYDKRLDWVVGSCSSSLLPCHSSLPLPSPHHHPSQQTLKPSNLQPLKPSTPPHPQTPPTPQRSAEDRLGPTTEWSDYSAAVEGEGAFVDVKLNKEGARAKDLFRVRLEVEGGGGLGFGGWSSGCCLMHEAFRRWKG